MVVGPLDPLVEWQGFVQFGVHRLQQEFVQSHLPFELVEKFMKSPSLDILNLQDESQSSSSVKISGPFVRGTLYNSRTLSLIVKTSLIICGP